MFGFTLGEYIRRRRLTLVGNDERIKQEKAFLTTTRAKQWLLLGASCEYSTDYMVITNIGDDGYDFYVAYKLDDPTRKDFFNPEVTGGYLWIKWVLKRLLSQNKHTLFLKQKTDT